VIKEGDKAPSFTLETDSGERVSLRDYADKTLVLYFYPKDSTPGCTREAQAFSESRRAIEKAGGAVLGVSRDSVKSHCSFRDKYGLTIPLASDPDLTVHKAYGAWGNKKLYGREFEGCIRTTFLVKGGRVARVFPNVKVDGHADAVLSAIAELDGTAPRKEAAPRKQTAAPAKKKTATAAKPKKKAAKGKA
jgi:peroxiredoxin Q/BCP